MDKKIKPIKSIRDMTKEKKLNLKLWKKVERLVKETIEEKIKAVNICFDRYYELPKEVNLLLLKMAETEQPENIRLVIAKRISSEPSIGFELYFDLLNVLAKDPSPVIQATIEKELKKINDMMNYLSKVMDDYKNSVALLMDSLSAIRLPKFEIPKLEFPIIDLRNFISSQKTIDFLVNVNKISEEVAKAINNSLSFYPPSQYLQLTALEPQKVQEPPLISKLKCCPMGKEHWKEFEDACEEILEYLFVPALNPPFVQDRTEFDLQRRDLIFDIPYDTTTFWNLIRLSHKSSAVIVECKNFSGKLPPNEVVITSKYFGEKRCGLFGLIITREGLNESAVKEQKRLWKEDNKMIICLEDKDLIKMILLKNNGHEPEIIIDDKIRTLRRSLE